MAEKDGKKSELETVIVERIPTGDVHHVSITPDDLAVGGWFKSKKERLKLAREIVDSVEGLNQSLIAHQRTADRLMKVGTEIRIDRNQREVQLIDSENRLADARRKARVRELQDQLEQEELELRLAQIKAQKEALVREGQSKPTGRPKSKVELVMEEEERWRQTQERLRERGLTEEHEQWKLLENEYQHRVKKIFQ